MWKYIFYIIFYFSFLILNSFCFSQNGKIDSLLSVLKTVKEDTNKVNALHDLAWEFKYITPDTSIILTQEALQLSEKLNWKYGIGKSFHYFGVFNWIMGNFPEALKNYHKALPVWEKLYPPRGGEKGAKTIANMGFVYQDEGDYAQALTFYLKALRIFETLGQKKQIAMSYDDIGSVYDAQKDFQKALNYYSQSLKIKEQLGDSSTLATTLVNAGNVYFEMDDLEKALEYYTRALAIFEAEKNSDGIARCFGNIGSICQEKGDNAKALGYFLKALQMAQELKNENRVAIQISSIGTLYCKMHDWKQGEKYLLQAASTFDHIGSIDYYMQAEKSLSDMYDTTGKYALALQHYKKYIAASDSISNDANTKKQTQAEMNYEFDKKQTADSITNAEKVKQEELKHEQEIQQQKTYSYGGAIGFLLMIIVAGVSFRAYKTKQKSNLIISEQKKLVEEKQKDILDSIRYAKRIQQSLLPTENYIDKNLKRLNG